MIPPPFLFFFLVICLKTGINYKLGIIWRTAWACMLRDCFHLLLFPLCFVFPSASFRWSLFTTAVC
ncbi:hypothetical protein IWX50DRAFT_624681, partial [Phyllosticta citricarpa]